MELQYLLGSLGNTLIVWMGSILFAVVLSIPVAAGRRASSPILRGITRVWVAIVRGLPPLVWMILLFFGIGTGLLGQSPMLSLIHI